MFRVQCTACKKHLRVPDSLRGKRVKCPNCQGSVDIPSAREDDQTPQDEVFTTFFCSTTSPELTRPSTPIVILIVGWFWFGLGWLVMLSFARWVVLVIAAQAEGEPLTAEEVGYFPYFQPLAAYLLIRIGAGLLRARSRSVWASAILSFLLGGWQVAGVNRDGGFPT